MRGIVQYSGEGGDAGDVPRPSPPTPRLTCVPHGGSGGKVRSQLLNRISSQHGDWLRRFLPGGMVSCGVGDDLGGSCLVVWSVLVSEVT